MSSTATEKWEQTALEHLVRSPDRGGHAPGGDGEGRAGRWGRSKVSAAGEMPFPRGCKEEGKQVCGHASEKERERGEGRPPQHL